LSFTTAVGKEIGNSLKDLGYQRRGTNIWRSSDSGDFAVVHLQTSSSSRRGINSVFYINCSICPAPWLAWLDWLHERPRPAGPPDPASGIWRARVLAAAPFGEYDTWSVAAENELAAVVPIAEEATRFIVTTVEPLMDRQRLLDTLPAGAELRLRLAFCAEQRNEPELHDLYRQLPQGSAFREWAAWYVAR